MPRTLRFLALALLVAACDSTAPSSGPLTIVDGGNYTYTAYSGLSGPVLIGTMHLEWVISPGTAIPPRLLGGTWETHWAPGADTTAQVGPQVGSGTLAGQTDQSGVQLSILPNLVDYGVSLEGLVHGYDVNGTWQYSTIGGPVRGGRFTLAAVR